MATVEFRRLDPPAFQAYGPTVGWFIEIGDGFNFIGVSARPFQSNDRVRLEGGVDAVSRNDGSQFTNFRVTIFPEGAAGSTGGLIRLAGALVGP